MTLTQFKKMTKQILRNINVDLLQDAERLFKSGGIDTAKYKDGAVLSKIIIRAAMDRHSVFLTPEMEKEAKNLRNF